MRTNIGQVMLERAAVETAVTVKLGLDLHAADVVVGRQDGGAVPRPSRRMSHEELLELCRVLVAGGVVVYSGPRVRPCGQSGRGQATPLQQSAGNSAA